MKVINESLASSTSMKEKLMLEQLAVLNPTEKSRKIKTTK